MPGSTLAVLGAGSWGTALGLLLVRHGHQVRLWTRMPDHVAAMQRDRCNAAFFPDIPFPDALQPEGSLAEALNAADDVIVVVPSHGFHSLLEQIRDTGIKLPRIAWATKGFESPQGRLLSEVAGEVLGASIKTAVISGPSFAGEVARDMPTAVAVASQDTVWAEDLCGLLHGGNFRAYDNNDVIGVQVGGAVKNILAIAVGISDGLGFGANARAALITRGLAETIRFGVALGGHAETFTGLAGLGDLVLTCTDNQSRNRRLGLALARGTDLAAAQTEIGQVVEGVTTAALVLQRAQRVGIEMPISEQVEGVLSGQWTPADAVHALLARSHRHEND